MKTRKPFTHIQNYERIIIEKLLHKGVRYLARLLGRSPSSLCNEIHRNSIGGIYSAENAQQKRALRRSHAKRDCLKVAMNSVLQKRVRALLETKHSPREISGYLKACGITCSPKAIYKFIYSRSLEQKLFWGWNKHKTGKKYKKGEKHSDGRIYIDERPSVVTGDDWEMDFVVSRQSSWVLFVLVNRLTRYSIVEILPNRKHTTISGVFSRLAIHYSMKTITTDNDIAFACWKGIEVLLHTHIYFTHPYHSWEKGLVENTNRWIRCFVHKKRDIRSVTEEELHDIHSFLNDRPRAVIGFQFPSALLLEHVS